MRFDRLGVRDALPEVEIETRRTGGSDAGGTIETSSAVHGRWTVVVVAGVALWLAFAVLSTDSQSTAEPVTPKGPASAAEVAASAGVVVIWSGDELSVREARGGDWRVLAHVRPGAAGATVALMGRWIVLQGTPTDSTGRLGTWAHDVAGRFPPRYLGSSDTFVPAARPDRVWLVEQGRLRQTDFDGAVEAGPIAAPGAVVASTDRGLVVQQHDWVVWWQPQSPDFIELIGAGSALAAAPRGIMWSTPYGDLAITDPETRASFTPPVPPIGWPIGSLSVDGHFVAGSGRRVAMGTTNGTTFSVLVPSPLRAVAWATPSVAVGLGEDGSIHYLDTQSGALVAGGSAPPGAAAIAFAATFTADSDWGTTLSGSG